MAAQIPTPFPPPRLTPLPRLRALPLTAPFPGIRFRSRWLQVASAVSGGGDGGEPPAEKGDGKPRGGPSLPALSEIRWGELLAPVPDNAAAVVLTAALVWAGASLLLQLVLISASIVAALLLFVLIALL